MGHYQETRRAWHETTLLTCELCGKIIPGNIWVADIEAQEHYFCTPDCERLYLSYWLPKYGKRAVDREIRQA